MELGGNSYSNKLFPEYIITTVLATWSFYSLFERITIPDGYVSKLTKFIGNNTLVILTWHFLSFKIVSLTIILIYELPIECLAEFPVVAEYAKQGWWIAYFLIGTFAPLAFVLTKHKCFKSLLQITGVLAKVIKTI